MTTRTPFGAAFLALLSPSVLVQTPEVDKDCPATGVVLKQTDWDRERAWLHAPGWFRPLQDPETVPLANARYGDNEPMMAVTVDGQTRAYPVRAMAYHHVANDVIGGQPVVVTY